MTTADTDALDIDPHTHQVIESGGTPAAAGPVVDLEALAMRSPQAYLVAQRGGDPRFPEAAGALCEDPLTGVWGPVTGRDPRVEAAALARLADPYHITAHEQAEADRAQATAEAERRAGLDDRVFAAARQAVADYEAGSPAQAPEPEPPAAAGTGDAPPLRRRGASATAGTGAQS